MQILKGTVNNLHTLVMNDTCPVSLLHQMTKFILTACKTQSFCYHHQDSCCG